MSIILKHGNTFKTTTCEHCGAKIGFSDSDIKPFLTMDIDWCEIYIDVVKCPECSMFTDADKNESMIARGIYK